MKTYEVVIQATVTKAIIVNAKDKDAAKEEAYEHFNITARSRSARKLPRRNVEHRRA